MRKRHSLASGLLFVAGTLVLLMTVVSCGGQTSLQSGAGGRYISAATLPPRPSTPTPTPDTPPSGPAKEPGGRIGLHVQFSEDWPSYGIHWQELWTVVQWRDNDGVWHDVEGWQGTIHEVDGNEGWGIWWLPDELFGRGPFRWMVYRPGEILEAQSEEFYLPERVRQTVWVEVMVGP